MINYFDLGTEKYFGWNTILDGNLRKNKEIRIKVLNN